MLRKYGLRFAYEKKKCSVSIDTLHIKQEYGNLYFEKLFNNTKEVKKDDDFGIYIDENNIKESLNYLKRKNVFN